MYRTNATALTGMLMVMLTPFQPDRRIIAHLPSPVDTRPAQAHNRGSGVTLCPCRTNRWTAAVAEPKSGTLVNGGSIITGPRMRSETHALPCAYHHKVRPLR